VALRRRGSLTIWIYSAMTREALPTGKRGRHPNYSDAAIQTFLTMKVLFGMAPPGEWRTPPAARCLPTTGQRPVTGS